MSHDVRKEYYDWLQMIIFSRYPKYRNSYNRLLGYLMDRDFSYTLDRDGDRYDDGEDLRYRFAQEMDISGALVSTQIDDRPCSVLEMMVALALRCEEDIMQDPYNGINASRWFWSMIVSLGLGGQTDPFFVEDEVEAVIYRFLRREYEPNGKGGLFTLREPKRDMRTVEIWAQAMWYLTEQWRDSERRTV